MSAVRTGIHAGHAAAGVSRVGGCGVEGDAHAVREEREDEG